MGVLAPIERYDNAASGLGLVPPVPQQGLQLTGKTSDESAVRAGLGLQYKLMQGLRSILNAPGADALIGGPWGALGSVLPGQMIRKGMSAQDIAGKALRRAQASDMYASRARAGMYADGGDESMARTLKSMAQERADRVANDSQAALHRFVESRMALGRATGTGLADPQNPLEEILNNFSEFSPEEIAAVIKTHNAMRPGFWERLMTPEKHAELFKWVNDTLGKR